MYSFFRAFWLTLSRLTCLMLLCILLTDASGRTPDTYRPQQRRQFLQAERAFRGGWEIQYQQLKWALQGYPLLQYLEYREAKRDLKRDVEGTTKSFLQRYPSSHLTDRLRRSWLARLAVQERWQEFLTFAPSSRLSTALRCHRLHALIATGRQQQAFRQISPLWLAGKSQPNACDPVFNAWNRAGKLTADLVWQRIALAMNKSQLNLVNHLKSFLDNDDQVWVERWLKVYRNPRLILRSAEFAVAHPWRETILLSGLKRLARKRSRQTPATWAILKNRYAFNDSQRAAARHAVALAYLRFAGPRTLDAVSRIDGVVDVDLQRKRIILALTRGRWRQVKSRIQVLPRKEREQPQWQYWKGRALQQLQQRKAAQTLLAQVSQDRTYYAFLAAAHGGYAYYLVNRPLQIEPALLQDMAQRKATLRAQELRTIGRIVDARLEWRWLTKDLDASGLQAAANLATNWRWHDQAIFTLARSGFWDDLNLRFPLEHLSLVKKFAQDNQLPPAWVLAIMRQESAFAEDAASPAGARGLMQLMPATAGHVAKKIGQPLPIAMDLLRPKINIELGTSYLREMLQRFDNNIVLATAAYNAGPGRVRRWLPKKTLNAEIWVEKIPFRETRTYVQRVLTYMILYEQRLGLKPGSIVQRMHPVRSRKAIRRAAAAR